MVDTITSFQVTNIPEIGFIAGTYKELPFEIKDGGGNPVDISLKTIKWALSPYGKPEVTTLLLNGVYIATPDKNRFMVYVMSTDTETLEGKFVQQPIIVGAVGYDFRLGQGYVNILPTVIL